MPQFIITKKALKQIEKLDPQVKNRILAKLTELKAEDDYRSIEKIFGMNGASHRLRVGDYRLILRQENEVDFFVISIGHRSSVYQK